MPRPEFIKEDPMMYCPKCRDEFREGFKKCPDCKVELVEELPAETGPEYIEPVTVFETGDMGLLLVVQSVLEDAGIRYYARGAGLQNLFALGTMGGFNPLTGPVQIQVNRDDAAAAAQLLKDLAEKS
jgi:hypothetical protein